MHVLILTKKNLTAIAAGIGAAALLCLAAFSLAASPGSVAASGADKKLPIYNVDTAEKK